jgi:hypothetical protein
MMRVHGHGESDITSPVPLAPLPCSLHRSKRAPHTLHYFVHVVICLHGGLVARTIL